MSEKEKYSLHYPSQLPAAKRLWVLQEGDLLTREGKTYRVLQVVRPKIVGGKPKLVLEPSSQKER